jgi:hypothetical protein
MIKPAERAIDVTRLGPAHKGVAAMAVAAALAWLIALAGLVNTVAALPGVSWQQALWLASLLAGPPVALWLTRRAIASSHVRAAVPLSLLEQRYHGRLEGIADAERRSLRPIAETAYEVAARTDDLLAELVTIPSVRIFQGLRPVGAGLPLIPHAISAGRQLVLIESVSWPPGKYETRANGGIYCDGMYIGQSVRPFIAGVQYWRKALPRGHHVSAVIVVHPVRPCSEGDITLPETGGDGLAWVRAQDAVAGIRGRLLSGRQAVSWDLLAAMIAATAEPAPDPDIRFRTWA